MINSATQCNEVTILEGVYPSGTKIGGGTYGRVFEVEYAGTVCVGKELHKHIAQSLDKETFLSYCHILKTICHPCIMQFLGVCYAESILPIMVMEKMQQSLRNLVERYVIIPWNVKLSILNDVCCGLKYLHGKNPPIVHCDLTPSNILLGGQLEAKLTDIGIAKLLSSNDRSSMNTILPFMPPEALDEKPTYTPAFDVFSFGCVILHVITQLWPELSNQSDVKKWKELPEIMKRNYRLDKLVEDVICFMKSSVISCLDVNPKNRPSVEQISEAIKEVKEKYNMKCSDDPTEWSAQVSREWESWEILKQQQHQQQ